MPYIGYEQANIFSTTICFIQKQKKNLRIYSNSLVLAFRISHKRIPKELNGLLDFFEKSGMIAITAEKVLSLVLFHST